MRRSWCTIESLELSHRSSISDDHFRVTVCGVLLDSHVGCPSLASLIGLHFLYPHAALVKGGET
jgi:hypothetical protein